MSTIIMYRYLLQDFNDKDKIFLTNWTTELISPNNYNIRFGYNIIKSYESLKNYDNKPDKITILKVERMEYTY